MHCCMYKKHALRDYSSCEVKHITFYVIREITTILQNLVNSREISKLIIKQQHYILVNVYVKLTIEVHNICNCATYN